MTAAKVALIHSMMGPPVRKFAVSSTRLPAAPKTSAAFMNVATSARRKR